MATKATVKELVAQPVLGEISQVHPEWRRDDLEYRVKQWAKKLARAGMPAPTLSFEEAAPIKWPPSRAHELNCPRVKAITATYRGVVTIKIDGDATLVGTVDLTHSEPIWALAPSQALSDRERAKVIKTAGRCEVCNTIRQRQSTILFRTPKGTLRQIGHNCAAKVFGVNFDLGSFIEVFGGGWDDEERWGSGGHGSLTVPFERLVTVAAAVIDRCGWVSRARSQAEGTTATVELVSVAYGALYPWGSPPKDAAQTIKDLMNGPPTEAHKALGSEVRQWCKNLPDRSDYERKLRVLAQDDWLGFRDWGVVASAVSAYRKAHNQNEQARTAAHSEWFGEPGQAVGLKKKGSLPPVEGDIVAIIPTEFSTIVKVMADKHLFVAFMHGTSGRRAGDHVKLAGTIKKHDAYKGIKQTVITRAKFIEAA